MRLAPAALSKSEITLEPRVKLKKPITQVVQEELKRLVVKQLALGAKKRQIESSRSHQFASIRDSRIKAMDETSIKAGRGRGR